MRAVLLTLLMLSGAFAGHAQTAPDAGALRQHVEGDRLPPLPARGDTLPAPGSASPASPAGTRVTVHSYQFAGNTRLDDTTLHAAVLPWQDRPITLAELRQAAEAVTQRYRQDGWIVHTELPPQDVSSGRVTLRIVEARFGSARVEAPPPTRVAAAQLQALVNASQAQGQGLNADALDRALLLAHDLPGVAVSGALAPGARDGETDLVLSASDQPLFSGEASLDNGGARSTGAERVTLGLRLNSPLGRGDQARVDLMASEGARYGQLYYGLPVGDRGLRIGARLSAFDYRLQGRDFAALNAKGDSSTAGIEARYPLLRSRLANLYLSADLERRGYRNQAHGATQSDYRVDALTLGLSGNRFSAQDGGGSTASLAWTQGRLSLGELDAGEEATRSGSYGRLRFGASHQQPLSRTLTLYAALSGQQADKALDSSERFYLGGPAGVRAYPVNEGSGSRGTLLNLELRWRVHPSVTATAFYDWGRATGKGSADTTLKGYGAAVGWVSPAGVELRAVLATRHGHNPHPSLTGKDQDGSHQRLRLWLQAGISF